MTRHALNRLARKGKRFSEIDCRILVETRARRQVVDCLGISRSKDLARVKGTKEERQVVGSELSVKLGVGGKEEQCQFFSQRKKSTGWKKGFG